ncbi:MAG: N-acetylmuramoyl-L-alanine amidase [Phycisphaerales bacterium]|nr:MAG: N-acetylmuramoyl-L-alanine amidase [Phycisphaerales bacterium]
MTAARARTSRLSHPSRRTGIVWASFGAAMTIVAGLLFWGSPSDDQGGLLIAVNPGTSAERIAQDPLFQIQAPLDRQRWTGIVIHHLGEPAGNAQTIHRRHLARGFDGLGYHFIIGNGNGLGDGAVEVGYRWNQQLAGAHVGGPAGIHHNNHSIAICLIGNGDRRSFTERQMASLVSLTQRLQRELNIPDTAVRMHRDLVSTASGPGGFFREGQFREQLREVRR